MGSPVTTNVEPTFALLLAGTIPITLTQVVGALAVGARSCVYTISLGEM